MSSEPGESANSNDDDRVATGAASPLGTVASPDTTGDMAILGHAMATGDSDLVNRYMVARNAGMAFGGERDYYDVLGYDRDPTAREYFAKYLRNDIARRIVNAPATASWAGRPQVIDDENEGAEDEAATDFEQAVEYLFDEHRLLHYLERVDKVTGIGEYGLLFMGLASGANGDEAEVGLDDDASGSSYRSVMDTMDDSGPDDLAYLATFSQARVHGLDTEDDPTKIRYGLPKFYDIEFSHSRSTRTEQVHYSRVIHVAEGLLENEVYGRPRLEAVLNRLEDLEKVVGGSAEMFWRGADRKLQLNYTGEGTPNDTEDTKRKAEELNHGLRNILPTTNMDVNEIEGQEVDPTGVVEQILKLIAGETGIPLRMLTGSERGELASTQDRATFYERIGERREQLCEPAILRPVLDRLIEFGILPAPDGESYTVEWPPLFELNELEQAELREKNANALQTAAPMGDPAQLATVPELRENVFDWDPERGSETSADVDAPDAPEGDGPEDVPDDDVTDETGEDRDAFEDILEDLDGNAADLDGEPLATDGGTDGE